VRMAGREAANDGIEATSPVGLGLMRSVEWLRLILCSFWVEKKAMEGDWEPERGRSIQSLLAGRVDGERNDAPVIGGYEEAKNLRKHKIHVRRVFWRVKASERAATYISEKKIQQCPHVRMVIRDEK
jgi:hypothetical protein